MATLPIGVRQFNAAVLREHLALLADPTSSFTIHVSTGESERILGFSPGGASVISTGERSGPGIPGLLHRRGKLDAAGLKAVLAESGSGKKALQEVLVERALVSAEEFKVLSRKLLRDEVLDLVFWEDALFRTSPTPPPSDPLPPDARILSAQLDTARFGEEVKTWSEKWGKLKATLHGDLSRISLTDDGRKALEGNGPEKPVLEAVGGGTSLRALWRGLELELQDLSGRLAGFVEKGWITVAPDPAAGEGKSAPRAIEALEEALPRAIGRDLACMRLANLCRKAKLGDKACVYLQVLADESAARGDWESACEGLRSLLSIRPQDGPALRQAVKIYLGQGRERQALALAFQVVQAHFREKRTADLESAAEVLAGLPRSEFLAREARADLCFLKDEKDRAGKEYQDLSLLYEERGEIERAKETIGKAMGCGAGNEDQKKRFLRLKRASADPRRSRGTSGRRPGPLGGLLAALPLRQRLVLAAAAGVLVLAIPFGAWLVLGKKGPAEAKPSRTAPAAEEEQKGAVHAPAAGTARKGAEERPAPAEVGGDRAEGLRDSTDPTGAFSISVSDPFGSALEELASAYGDGSASSPAHGSVPRPQGTAGSPGDGSQHALSSAGASAAAGEPPGERGVAGGGLCPRHGTHLLETRRIGPKKRIRFAHSCDLLVEDSETGEVVLDIEGSEGSRWAIGSGGERVCSWRAGERAVIYRDQSPDPDLRTSWIIPPGTEALAVGRETLALRQGATTRLFTIDGIQVRAGKLPAWDEGMLTGSALVIAGSPEGEKAQRRLWLVDARTLKLVKPPAREEKRGSPDRGR